MSLWHEDSSVYKSFVLWKCSNEFETLPWCQPQENGKKVVFLHLLNIRVVHENVATGRKLHPKTISRSKHDSFFFLFIPASAFLDNSHHQNRNPMTCHTSAHTLLMSPRCRQHLASSFLSLLIYFYGRGGGRIPHSSYWTRCGASHLPLSAPFRVIFFFLSVRSEFGKSVLHKLSWWQSVSVKHISGVHVVIFLLFVCFVQICAHAHPKTTPQFKHLHAQMQTAFGVDYITPQVCFPHWCHRLMVCSVLSSSGQMDHD